MEREEYAAELKRLKTLEFEAYRSQMVLEAEYAKKYPVQPNDKVVCVYADRHEKIEHVSEAYVLNICVHDDGSMTPRLMKCKLDGSMSKHRLYLDGKEIRSINKIS